MDIDVCETDLHDMDKYGIIELEGMEFHAFHGCFEKEKTEAPKRITIN